MGDKNNGNTLSGDDPHGIQQPLRFALGQHRRRLIKYQQPDTGFIDLPGNFDELHIAHRQPGYLLCLRNFQADGLQGRSGILGHGIQIQGLHGFSQKSAGQVGLGEFPAHLDIFCYGKARNQHELLVDHADPQLQGLLGCVNIHRLAPHLHGTLKATGTVDHRHAEKDVHKGGFSRAIFSHQGVDLAGLYPKADSLEHPVAAVFLHNIVHFQDVFTTQTIYLLCCCAYKKHRRPPQAIRRWQVADQWAGLTAPYVP